MAQRPALGAGNPRLPVSWTVCAPKQSSNDCRLARELSCPIFTVPWLVKAVKPGLLHRLSDASDAFKARKTHVTCALGFAFTRPTASIIKRNQVKCRMKLVVRCLEVKWHQMEFWPSHPMLLGNGLWQNVGNNIQKKCKKS